MYKGHESIKNIYDLSQKFIQENQLSVELLVDFGARHGESLEYLGALCQRDYVFVEPAPKCVSVINGLIAAHSGLPRLKLIDGILGSVAGEISLHTFETDDDQSANVFTDRGGKYGASIPVSVPVISYEQFDTMFPGPIDFAKINIEGGEYELIDDGFFHRKINAFVMELHNEHVADRSWRYAKEKLEADFDIVTHGELNYKYCFMSGKRCR